MEIFIVFVTIFVLFAIISIVNYIRNPNKTTNYQPPKPKPTQAERDAYYIQQFGMTEADYMATVDMYANWDD